MSRKRSWVWSHCTKSSDGFTATCNICDEEFKIQGSTSSLNKHLKSIHDFSDGNHKREKQELSDNDVDGANENSDVENSSDLPSASASHISTHRSRTRRIIKANRTKKIVPCNKTRTENIDQALSKLIVTNMLPFSFAESDGFKNFMAVVEPGYKIPCVETVKKRIDLLYNVTKDRVKKELDSALSIVAVSDCWSSRAQDAYLTVSAHYLTETWQPTSVCLATQEADERHSAENLCIRMSEIINDYGLKNKVTAVVTDNAANAVNSVKLLECVDETFDVQCAAHTLQLAVHEGLKLQPIQNLCSKASKVVGHFKHSNVAGYALEEKQQQLELKKLKLIQDCPTRWNSTYFMIERLVENRSAIQAVLADRRITKAHVAAKLDVSEVEWKKLEDIADSLKPLQLTTTVLCAEKSSISLVRPLIRTLIDNHLQEIKKDKSINDFRSKIRNSLEARFHMSFDSDVSPRQIASFLDPRYKDLDAEEPAAKLMIREIVQQKILDLTPTSDSDKTKSEQSALDILFKKSVTSETNSAANQFQRYLSEPSISYNDCPYDWWKNHADKYSTFVPLVKKYLAIPATSTASERVFSTAGNIVNTKRVSLHTENVDKLIFLYQNRSFLG